MVKAAVSLFSSLILGLMLKDVLRAKNRLIVSVGLCAAAFVFIMAGILTGAIAQFGVATGTALGFLAVGVLTSLAAKFVFPKPQVHELLGGLDGAQFSELADQFLQGFQAGMTTGEPTPTARPQHETPAPRPFAN